MKKGPRFVLRAVLGGFLFVIPVYLAVLLLLKGMKSVAGIVRPLARLLPESVPADTLLSLLLVLVVCFLIGAAFQHSGRKQSSAADRENLVRTHPRLCSDQKSHTEDSRVE